MFELWTELLIPPHPGRETVHTYNPKLGPDTLDERLKMGVKATFAQKWLGADHPKAKPPAEVKKIVSGVAVKGKGGKEKKVKDGVPLKQVILALIRLVRSEVDGGVDQPSLYEFKSTPWAAQIHGKHCEMTDTKGKVVDGSKLSAMFALAIAKFRMANNVTLQRRAKVLKDSDTMGDDDVEGPEVDEALTAMYEKPIKDMGEKRLPMGLPPASQFAVQQVQRRGAEQVGSMVRIQIIVRFAFGATGKGGGDDKKPPETPVPLALDAIGPKTQDTCKLDVRLARARVVADLMAFLLPDRRKGNVDKARIRILPIVMHHTVCNELDTDGMQKLAVNIFTVMEKPDMKDCAVCGKGGCKMPDVHFPSEEEGGWRSGCRRRDDGGQRRQRRREEDDGGGGRGRVRRDEAHDGRLGLGVRGPGSG